MLPCPTCGHHVRARDATCFACGATLVVTSRRSTAAALLLGLSVACTGTTTAKDSDTGDTGTTVQPLYGVTVTDTATTTPQPEYGVTITDTAEPDHSGDDHSGDDHSGHSGAR